ncbi:MAG TPA: phosphatidate cytidylyltransferase [Solirubrobacteraceae bacterium]
MASGRRPPAGRRPGAGRGTRSAGAPRGTGGRERPPRRRREPRQRGGSDLLARIAIAVPAAIVAIIFIDLGGVAFAVFLIAIGCLCLHELYRMLHRWRPVSAVGFAALAAMVLLARTTGVRAVLEVAVIAVPVLFLLVVMRGQSRPSVSIAGTLLGVYWIGFAFAHAELLRQLPHGDGVVIDVVVGTFVGDTAAYVGGRIFGRRPLAPQISPNKTVEGLFCGMLMAIVAVFVAGLYQAWLTQGDALVLGVAVAILAPIGDLFESLIKRDAEVKDTGQAFGAHGGALDRLDAVMFTIVAGYYIWLSIVH